MIQNEWIFSLPWDLIKKAGNEHKISWRFLGALIMTESGGNPYVTRFEPNFNYLLHPDVFSKNLGITKETEISHQKTSWGLCQMMGTVARECGYQSYLTQIIEPTLNLDLACKHIKKIIERLSPESESAIFAAYNAGGAVLTTGGFFQNQKYVDRASNYLQQIESAVHS